MFYDNEALGVLRSERGPSGCAHVRRASLFVGHGVHQDVSRFPHPVGGFSSSRFERGRRGVCPKRAVLVLGALLSLGVVLPGHAASRLEKFRASVHPASGETFTCRSNSNILCAYSLCVQEHPGDAGAGESSSCQKLSVPDAGTGTEPYCAIGLYRLAADDDDLFGAVTCGNSAEQAKQAMETWGRENERTIVSTRSFGPVSAPPEVVVDRGSEVAPAIPGRPPFLVVYAEPTNGRRGGGTWHYCSKSDRSAAARCAQAACEAKRQYAPCVETGATGSGGTCAVASAKGFGVSWGSCAGSRAAAREAALADCKDQVLKYYPGSADNCAVTQELPN